MKLEIPPINFNSLVKKFMSVTKQLMAMVPGGTKHYFGVKSWQRSCRNHAVKSRVRHTKRKASCGYRYKGGK